MTHVTLYYYYYYYCSQVKRTGRALTIHMHLVWSCNSTPNIRLHGADTKKLHHYKIIIIIIIIITKIITYN